MIKRIVPAANFCGTLVANVDNKKLSDKEFREFVRRTLPIVIYEGAPEPKPERKPEPKPPATKTSPLCCGTPINSNGRCRICAENYYED